MSKKNLYEYKNIDNKYFIKLFKDAKLNDVIKEICKTENIQTGIVTGLGSVKSITLGCFNLNTKTYKTSTFEGYKEILALNGNITEFNNEPYLHAHAIVGDENYQTKGGHLFEAVISFTAEIILTKVDGKISRIYDNECGDYLFNIAK